MYRYININNITVRKYPKKETISYVFQFYDTKIRWIFNFITKQIIIYYGAGSYYTKVTFTLEKGLKIQEGFIDYIYFDGFFKVFSKYHGHYFNFEIKSLDKARFLFQFDDLEMFVDDEIYIRKEE